MNETPAMPTFNDVVDFLSSETGLAVVSTVRADGTVLSSVANCGPIDHPVTRESCVAFVSVGSAARLSHVRRGSAVTVTVRRGWRWVAVAGPADLVGPEDLLDGVGAEGLRVLLRDVFHATGGAHEDLVEYDRAMADEGRVVVLVRPDRILGNP